MAEPKTVPINVSSRVLRHISRGIYRTPAGALKELVSNSYDAGAREVTVTTGWPDIKQIVITDNGKGMSEAEYTDLVQHIGFSKKKLGDEFVVPGTSIERRTIGHYGIGLLAVGQLASVMTIRSKPDGTQAGFTAEVKFDQFDHVDEHGIARSEIQDEEQIEELDDRGRSKTPTMLRIGTCKVWREQYSRERKGDSFTKITLTDVRKFVHQHLVGESAKINPASSESKRYSADFQELLSLLREQEAEVGLGWYPYERLIWEMAVYCPVAYPDIDPFRPGGKLRHHADLAAKSQFSLKIDGIHVKKPFEQAFFTDQEYPVEKIFSWHDETVPVRETALRTSGYLIYKRRIRPKSIQGVLVREAGVAIGLYDTTFLHYPFNEGQKLNQLTGEIYVTGLAGALNIDRNSFNETDDSYVAFCKWFHKKLRDGGVFTKIKQLQSSPDASRRVENRDLIANALKAFAEESECQVRSVRFQELGKDEPLLTVRGNTLIINQDHRDGAGSGATREKTLLAAALVMRGIATPHQVDDVDELLRKIKKAIKD